MVWSKSPILSIAIPAYDRPNELLFGLRRFVSQIAGKYDEEIEIVVSDDCSPSDSLHEVRALTEAYSFIKFRRYQKNIGLESNLITCADVCTGEYLWLFGDDDFLESGDDLDFVMSMLRSNNHDFYILNRTRRNFDLSRLISPNWMRLDEHQNYKFAGLRDFCLRHGFISVIGFISVNIFRRMTYQNVDASKYFGTMYPQLGAMLEAFHDRRTLLIGRPIVCHRTQTPEEKRAVLGEKRSEADFMADVERRNALYFSHPYVAMLDELVQRNAFRVEDIVSIPENTVINGLLVDFMIQTVTLNNKISPQPEVLVWRRTKRFFARLPLDDDRRKRINQVFASRAELKHDADGKNNTAISGGEGNQVNKSQSLTISVVTPSFNQGEFLSECLTSVRDQTYRPIEHMVFDPGSTDGSREIAETFPHVVLIAEPDDGQSDALNKGFLRSRGDIIAWVNSDDMFADERVFERVVERFNQPDKPDIVYGKGVFIDEHGEKLRNVYINKDPDSLVDRLQHEDGILQPALFMRKTVIERVGMLRKNLHYSMDYEYWIRCMKEGMKFVFIDDNLAIARYHSANKTYGMRGKSYEEVCEMMKEQFGYVNHIWIRRYAEYLAEGHDGVLASAVSVGVNNPEDLERYYRELLVAYNTGYDVYHLLEERAREKGYGDTLRELKQLGIKLATPCKPIPLDRQQEPGHVCYTVGKCRWAFDAKWKTEEIRKAHTFLRERIRSSNRDICVIVGNGPSLNKIDLSLLKGQDTIISNNTFLSPELMQYATYYTVVNYLVGEQSSHFINRLSGIHKILPYWTSYCLNPGPDTYFVDAVGHAEFSKDMFKNMSWRHTVTFFNLHLAYGLGYKKVILVGFDHSYKQAPGVIEQEIIQNYEDDENHFSPDYFRGKKWQAADVDMMEEMYRLAKAAYEEDGREIINCTVGGKLELFKRMSLEDALKQFRVLPGINPTFGPFSRKDAAHWDETNGVAQLFSHLLKGAMIDVGAHHGYAMAPFLDRSWRIFAFEPDEKNREKLLERLANHKSKSLVSLDTRCVSNKSQKGVSFYRSEQSTGISGLSAFLESHVEAQKVDTVTLTEFFENKPLQKVDFLKIDTEGYDFFVLQGFPWERTIPAVIECEFEDSKTVPLGYTFHDLASFLVNKGYTVYVSEWHPIIRYGIRHDWNRLVRYPCELADEKGWGNLLAFRDPISEEDLVAAVKKELKVGTGKMTKLMATPLVKIGVTSASHVGTKLVKVTSGQSRKVLSNAHFTEISANQWRYTHSGAAQKLWQVVFSLAGSSEGRTFVAGIRLKVNRTMTVNVSIGRYGTLEYEGANKRVKLEPGVVQTVPVRKEFDKPHTALKVQMDVVQLEGGGTADLTIDLVSVNETLASIQHRVNESDLNLREANRMFRAGDFSTAMGMYLLLRQQYPLRMYSDNALMAARKLGMDSVQTVEQLMQLLV